MPMYNVIVSKKAYEDLDNIYKYIAFEKEDKFAARKNIDGINASLCSLKNLSTWILSIRTTPVFQSHPLQTI